jgi:hypothetical protein
MLFLASDLPQPVSGRAANTLLLCLLSTVSAINLPSYVTFVVLTENPDHNYDMHCSRLVIPVCIRIAIPVTLSLS